MTCYLVIANKIVLHRPFEKEAAVHVFIDTGILGGVMKFYSILFYFFNVKFYFKYPCLV